MRFAISDHGMFAVEQAWILVLDGAAQERSGHDVPNLARHRLFAVLDGVVEESTARRLSHSELGILVRTRRHRCPGRRETGSMNCH
jgi:hypothetical protein